MPPSMGKAQFSSRSGEVTIATTPRSSSLWVLVFLNFFSKSRKYSKFFMSRMNQKARMIARK